jgi:protein-disulfide isomerase
VWGLTLLLTASGPATAAAQGTRELDGLRNELQEIRQGQAAILKEVQDLRTLILGAATRAGARGPRSDATLPVDGASFLGNARAPVTLVEFTDYQCPFCGRYARETFPQIERDYVKTGKVKYVMRDFPIAALHPQAFKGHEAARCAGDQGKLWEMHRRLFADQKAMGPAELEAHAQAVGLDLARFRQCLDGGKYAAAVRGDLEEGNKAGVSGTPTFLIGLTDLKEPVIKVSRVLTGAQPYERFKEAIDALLQPAASPSAPKP